MARLFHIDAFTTRPLGGAPAPVIVTDNEISSPLAAALVIEFNQPILAVLHPGTEGWAVRFYETNGEVGLVGHAGLAAGFVALTALFPHQSSIVLTSPVGGDLPVSREGSRIFLEFAMMPASKTEHIAVLDDVIGNVKIAERLEAPFGSVAVLETENEVRNLAPDLVRALDVPGETVIVTAPGDNADFVSRVFAPKSNLPEDPVCGTAQRILVPYWAKRLGRSRLIAHQLSKRGGHFDCELRGDVVRLGGNAATLFETTLDLQGAGARTNVA